MQIVVGVIYGIFAGMVAAYLTRAVNRRAGTPAAGRLQLVAIVLISVVATGGIGVLRLFGEGTIQMGGSIAYGVTSMICFFGGGLVIGSFIQKNDR